MFRRVRWRKDGRPSPRQEVSPLETPTVATGRRERLTRIAWRLTGVWGLLFVLGVLLKLAEAPVMSLNEWGDFFAGAAAPLALLWLVIGYYQHGEELRLNTQALYSQQLELQNQVEETAKLVEATREDLQYQRDRDARLAAPVFTSRSISTGAHISTGRYVSVEIENRGAEVRNVKLHCDGPYDYTLPELEFLPTNGWFTFSIQHGNEPPDYPITFRISWVDRLGQSQIREFEIPEEGKSFRPAQRPNDSTILAVG